MFSCIERQQECLKCLQIADLQIENLKEMIGSYLRTLKDKSSQSNRSYKNNQHWNFSIDIAELSKLKFFLDPFFGSVVPPSDSFDDTVRKVESSQIVNS